MLFKMLFRKKWDDVRSISSPQGYVVYLNILYCYEPDIVGIHLKANIFLAVDIVLLCF